MKMTFKNHKYLYHYDVLVNGEKIGTVWKTQKRGYPYWKNAYAKVLFNTRRDAALNLMYHKGVI